MAWDIKCEDAGCTRKTRASDIVDLLSNHRDPSTGLFLCACGSNGYITKSFSLQEEGQMWKPVLRGALRLADADESYQPFVFLVSYKPGEMPSDIWFSYYKDLRKDGGRLKLGYGPGGPPVLDKGAFLGLLRQLVQTGQLSAGDVAEVLASPELKEA